MEVQAVGRPIDDSTERCLSLLAHDLAGPLTALRGYAEVLGPDLSATTLERATEGIKTATRRMDGLLHLLRETAALGAGPPALECAPVRLRDLVSAACERVGTADDVELDVDVHDTVVVGDRDRLVAAIEHLVANAARHTPPGSAIAVVGRGSGSTAQVRVTDRGRARPADAGLGLHLAAAVARAHGGELSCRRSPDGGTEHVLDLPVWGP